MKKNILGEVFSSCKEERRGALIAFLTAGDPTPKHTLRLCDALIKGGADVLELGIPFSDPIADGPTIQEADLRSLRAGNTPEECLRITAEVRRKHEDLPLVSLSYYNIIFRLGVERFLSRASNAGVNGLIVPDLPPIAGLEFERYKALAVKKGLSTILLASPTTSRDRLVSISLQTSGFLYLVSLLGVTGARKKRMSGRYLNFISEACLATNDTIPVAVGFGISEPGQVKSVLRAGADGVIVGSAFVNIVASNLDDIDGACKQLATFCQALRKATPATRR